MSAPNTHAAPSQEQDNTTDPLLNSQPFEKYADAEEVEEALPITSYAALMTVYFLAFCALLAAAKRRDPDEKLPEKMDWCDLAVFSLAVFQTSRTISKGWVTIPVRAAFAKYDESSVLPSEVHETPRGKGLQRAIGELLTCPFCLGTWAGLGLGYGWVFAPRATRLLTGIAAMSAVSNFLHIAYTFSCQQTHKKAD